jgi:dihydroxy-acid dehydratase
VEDFYYAGGLPGLMARLRVQLYLDAVTVTGRTLGDNIAASEVYNDEVIRPLENPIDRE